MQYYPLDETTAERLEGLVQANFGGRDKLYAAAQTIDNEDCKKICEQIAEQLAAHASELQQVLIASGHDPNEPLDIDYIVNALIQSIKKKHGASGVIQAVENAQQDLKKGYERAMEESPAPQTEEMLRDHREQIDFGERVLRGIKKSESTDDEKQ